MIPDLAHVLIPMLIPRLAPADLALLLAPVLLAGLVVVLWRRKRAAGRRPWAVLDGSNILYWMGGAPDLAPVRAVLDRLGAQGYEACVVFDANAGHLLFGRYAGARDFAARLGLPERRVMVVPRGTPADPAILAAAREVGGIIVTNDRYRDWVEKDPDLRDTIHLVTGGYREGALWLGPPGRPPAGRASGRPGTLSRRAS